MTMKYDFYKTSAKGDVIESCWLDSRPVHSTREDSRVFDKKIYSKEIHSPVLLFQTNGSLQQELPRCLDLPIRLKGQDAYSIPEEWKSLLPLLARIFKSEHGSNHNWKDDYYTYMTVDSSFVEADEQQRHGGLHVDGFQGSRIQQKTKITRNYVASSNGGTRFYPQLFNTNSDESVYNLFKDFERQAQEPNRKQNDFIEVPDNTVAFMDAYSVHESGLATRAGIRTFFRVTYDVKEFDRLGNSHNSMLEYDWKMVRRNAQDFLYSFPDMG
jgi:hypothetical protein